MVTTYSHAGRDLLFPFGSLSQEFDKVFKATTNTTYPPYNIVKVTDDHIVMEFAVAGFKKDDISVTTEKNVLTIKSTKDDSDEKDYLHKGIAARKFTRAFNLPEYFEVDGASVDNGILYIDLIRNIPEEKKPKTIKIK